MEAALGGAKKTHIKHWANVNYQSFGRYFPVLLNDGLVLKVEDPEGWELCQTTDEGPAVLKTLTSITSRQRKRT